MLAAESDDQFREQARRQEAAELLRWAYAITPPKTAITLGLDRLVWRTAAVAAVLALVFTGFVLFFTNRDTAELTALLSNEIDVVAPLSE